jgi:hypothetical protein
MKPCFRRNARAVAGDLLILSPAFLIAFNSVFSWLALRLVMPEIMNSQLSRARGLRASKF